ncbi:MAG TPA: hypothetical protein VGJ21_10330 [Terracidiphilus sp.]|jgi:hypothetical protein
MEVILRTVYALLGGFAVMTALVFAVTMVLMKRAPAWVGTAGKPNPSYLLVNVGYSFLAAAAGGYVTAWIAADNPLPKILMLAIAVLVMSAISALEARGRQPAGYQIALAVLAPIGVIAGGLLRLMVMGLI